MDDETDTLNSASDSEEPRPAKEQDHNLKEGVGVNYDVVPGEKKNARLVKFEGYLYRTRGSRISATKSKNLTYLMCRHMTKKSGNPCKGSALIQNGMCTAKAPHTCVPGTTAQARTEAHELKSVMKKRAIAEGTTLQVCV